MRLPRCKEGARLIIRVHQTPTRSWRLASVSVALSIGSRLGCDPSYYISYYISYGFIAHCCSSLSSCRCVVLFFLFVFFVHQRAIWWWCRRWPRLDLDIGRDAGVDCHVTSIMSSPSNGGAYYSSLLSRVQFWMIGAFYFAPGAF